MGTTKKSRRNALLVGAAVVVFGIIQLIVAHSGYKTHKMIPAGEAEGQFMTPMQGYIVAGLAFAFGAYAIARGLLEKHPRDNSSR